MKKAFTMMEILIVIVIIGVLATLVIPKLFGPREQAIFSEATTALTTLRGAQLRYALEHGGGYTADCTNLDVTVAPTNFGAPTCTAAGGVSLTRNGGTYTVSASAAGVFTCPACPANLKAYCPGTPCP
jgi:prepilin-type N-terminal cleavage/methylation domain-containing protein